MLFIVGTDEHEDMVRENNVHTNCIHIYHKFQILSAAFFRLVCARFITSIRSVKDLVCRFVFLFSAGAHYMRLCSDHCCLHLSVCFILILAFSVSILWRNTARHILWCCLAGWFVSVEQGNDTKMPYEIGSSQTQRQPYCKKGKEGMAHTQKKAKA